MIMNGLVIKIGNKGYAVEDVQFNTFLPEATQKQLSEKGELSEHMLRLAATALAEHIINEAIDVFQIDTEYDIEHRGLRISHTMHVLKEQR